MGDDLRVGLAIEFCAFRLKLEPQLAKILDDAVVNHGDVIGGVRMGVVLGRLAMGSPARVPDTGMARQRRRLQARFEIAQLAFGAAALEMRPLQRGDTGGIVAAIFEALQ